MAHSVVIGAETVIDLNQPQVTAAFVGGGVALIVGIITVSANAFVTARIAERKLRADRDQSLSDKAWGDYEPPALIC